ncbi:MAG TPA: tryptophan--tRNA ligase [Actinomycetota bacterium]|nr:tryptophan--tRNA ligase [Actinomycetota bacterium]
MFSGVQPTANVPHLGNYIGAFRQWVALQDQHECFFCVVDLHSLTVPWDPKILAQRSRSAAASLIAAGIDPERAVLFLQSEVPEHTELSWILTCVSRMGELSRMTQFKDKSRNQEGDSIGTGLYVYPVLMAADVLAYRGELVPVGDDQRQHLELMRNIAERFNRDYGDTFPVPDPYIPAEGARIMALDDPTRKMDKSSDRPNNLIWMNDPPDVVRRKIARAVTDSGREVRTGDDKPAVTNLLTIYSAVTGRPVPEIEREYDGKGYGDFKAGLSQVLVDFLDPFRSRHQEVLDDPAQLDKILDAGAARAREVASETMKIVRRRVGLRRP